MLSDFFCRETGETQKGSVFKFYELRPENAFEPVDSIRSSSCDGLCVTLRDSVCVPCFSAITKQT